MAEEKLCAFEFINMMYLLYKLGTILEKWHYYLLSEAYCSFLSIFTLYV